MNTVKTGYIVVRQFYKAGERFTNWEEATRHAECLAKRIAPERVEIFECIENLFVDIPVIRQTEIQE